MGEFFNLLNSAPKVVRDVAARRVNKEQNRALALKYDFEYFDGPREQGYGGYQYDGRWQAVARRLIERYNLQPGDRVLDIGCAKGFLVKDLRDALPGLEVWGLDISTYAISHASEDVRPFLLQGTAERLPFPDRHFKLAVSINTAHNLDYDACKQALREMVRVAPHGFFQVDAYRNEQERQVFEDWMLTAKTYLTPDGWQKLFAEAGYDGDYYWTILEIDENLQQ